MCCLIVVLLFFVVLRPESYIKGYLKQRIVQSMTCVVCLKKYKLYSFKPTKIRVKKEKVDSISGIFQTCKIYLWVDGPAPAYSAKSRSTNPIWSANLSQSILSQNLMFTLGNALFKPYIFLNDKSCTFLKFLPPFSSFLMETLHLQESRTPVEELAAI